MRSPAAGPTAPSPSHYSPSANANRYGAPMLFLYGALMGFAAVWAFIDYLRRRRGE